MSALKILAGRCVGCGSCIEACPFGAIRMDSGVARVTEKCTLCGACANACAADAIEYTHEIAPAAGLSAYRGVYVYCEVSMGRLRGVALELLGQARRLADALQTKVTAIVPGSCAAALSATLIACGADTVLTLEDPRLDLQNDLLHAEALCAVAEEYRPSILLFGATSFGRAVAPRLAAKLKTGLTADCTALEADPATGLLRQTRPAFGGNLMATILCPNHRPQMATVRPRVFLAPAPDFTRTGRVVRIEPALLKDCPLQVSRPEAAAEDFGNIAEADLLISVGRGAASAENIALAETLARLTGGMVSCSRPLVDEGVCPYRMQVGQTGKTVAPKVYLALGISGAVQHLAGIAAETVIAVNTDPDAPIFRYADYAIVGDAANVLRELVDALK